MCELYSERTPKVAPETSLQVSNRALLKLQSAQSRCGFQAFIHAEKLQLTYMLPILALLFHALKMSLFFIFAFQNLSFLGFFFLTFFFFFFFTLLPEISAWPQSTAFCEGLLQPISGRGTTCGQKGALFSLWEGGKTVYLLHVSVNISDVSTST